MRRAWISLFVAALVAGAGQFAQAQAPTTLPIGTEIIVTLNQAVSSKDAKVGQTISGSVTNNITAGARTVIPKGARAQLSVTSVNPSGHLKGVAELWLKVNNVQVRGATYTLTTNPSGQKGESHNKRNVVAIGGGTAAGALIGGPAGGGKGAAIGAIVGAGAGTAGAAATGKKDINYPAETQLRFTLKTAATIR